MTEKAADELTTTSLGVPRKIKVSDMVSGLFMLLFGILKLDFKELALEIDDESAWIARLMGKGGGKLPAKDTNEQQAELAAEAE